MNNRSRIWIFLKIFSKMNNRSCILIFSENLSQKMNNRSRIWIFSENLSQKWMTEAVFEFFWKIFPKLNNRSQFQLFFKISTFFQNLNFFSKFQRFEKWMTGAEIAILKNCQKLFLWKVDDRSRDCDFWKIVRNYFYFASSTIRGGIVEPICAALVRTCHQKKVCRACRN